MKKNFILAGILLLAITARAQDYFEDIKGTGTPILINADKNKWLFVTRLTTGDNSAKINLYKQWKFDEQGWNPLSTSYRNKYYVGAGLFGKVKTENGIGSIFSSNHIAPGYSGGGYVVLSKKIWKQKDSSMAYKNWFLILSGSVTGASYQLYDTTTKVFADQLKDSSFSGGALGLSFVYKTHPGKDNLYVGLSMLVNKKNNYGKMDKVDIKNDFTYNNGGWVRTISIVNDNGYTYGIGPYKEFTNFNIRGNIGYVPHFLDHQVGFVFYPSVDFTETYNPQWNLGFSVNLLKEKSPAVTIAAIFFEFSDLDNAKNSTKPFMKRSFSIGLTTAFNIVTGGKE